MDLGNFYVLKCFFMGTGITMWMSVSEVTLNNIGKILAFITHDTTDAEVCA